MIFSVMDSVRVGPKTFSLLSRACSLIPAAEEEAGIINVVVEVVMGEEKVVDLGGPEAGLDQLVGGCRAAVEHEVLPIEFYDEGRAKAVGGGCRGPGPEDVYLAHNAFLPPSMTTAEPETYEASSEAR